MTPLWLKDFHDLSGVTFGPIMADLGLSRRHGWIVTPSLGGFQGSRRSGIFEFVRSASMDADVQTSLWASYGRCWTFVLARRRSFGTFSLGL